jgi:phage repressor protein C with HTH and peptisase S24 domain
MKNDAEIRRAILERFVDQYGLTAVAKRFKKPASQINDMVAGRKSFGDKVARAMEISGGLHKYAFEGIAEVSHQTEFTIEAIDSTNNKDDKYVTINEYGDVAGSMGNGILLPDQPGQITQWTVTPEWINKNVPSNTGKENLCIVTGFGDSMLGMFNPGDPLLVDRGVKECKHDGVYFFRVGDEGFIKTLQRIPGQGILVISENPKYQSWTITKDMDFQVLAKVITVWKSTKY